MKIVLTKSEPLKPSVCWMDYWVSPYESAYSLLSKYTYLNGLRTPVIAREFIRQKLVRDKKKYDYSNFSLIQATHLDKGKMAAAFRIPEAAINDAFVPNEINPATIPMAEHLRFCPTCLKIGYHSIAHQFEVVQMCPIHNRRIQSHCLKCECRVQYRVHSTLFSRPFCCPHCTSLCYGTGVESMKKYSSLNEEEVEAFRDLISLIELKHKVFDCGVDINRATSFFNQEPVLLPGRLDSRPRTSYIAFLGSALRLTMPKQQSTKHLADCALQSVRHTGFLQKHEPTETQSRRRYPCDGQGIFRWQYYDEKLYELRTIYKAIRRHVYRRLLKGHKSCANLTLYHIWWNINGESTPAICPLAYAFVQWVSFWEGTSIPRQLITKPNHPPYRLMAWLSDSAPYTPKWWPPNVSVWVRHRIFALDCLRSFYSWVDVANRLLGHTAQLHWSKEYASHHASTYWLAQVRDPAPALIAFEKSSYPKPIGLLLPADTLHRREHRTTLGSIKR